MNILNENYTWHLGEDIYIFLFQIFLILFIGVFLAHIFGFISKRIILLLIRRQERLFKKEENIKREGIHTDLQKKAV